MPSGPIRLPLRFSKRLGRSARREVAEDTDDCAQLAGKHEQD